VREGERECRALATHEALACGCLSTALFVLCLSLSAHPLALNPSRARVVIRSVFICGILGIPSLKAEEASEGICLCLSFSLCKSTRACPRVRVVMIIHIHLQDSKNEVANRSGNDWLAP